MMSAMLADFKLRWSGLPARTRLLAGIGTVVVVLALIYFAAWRPLQKDLARLRLSVPQQAGQLEWMRTQTPVAKSMRARTVTSSSALAPIVEQSAATHGVRNFVTKIDADGNAAARVTLEAIPFNSLVSWISELQATSGAVVDDAAIDAHASPGLVNARLRLRAGAS
jgi:general secretion pathway protein M